MITEYLKDSISRQDADGNRIGDFVEIIKNKVHRNLIKFEDSFLTGCTQTS